jgi:ATP-dependent DNA helicase RecQ
MTEKTNEALKRAVGRFGFRSFLPGQQEAIVSVVDGRDTLVVRPTGSGKSAIYQIAGLLLDGLTIVVSPLIALQRDQAEYLEEINVGESATLNSTLTDKQRAEVIDHVTAGALEYLFLAPEQLANEDTVEILRTANVSLLVVDEAHCISAWGHDFRPDYMRLGRVRDAIGGPRVLALTATASPLVRDEIVERLEMVKPNVLVRGFDRPNIRLDVRRFADERAKVDALIEYAEGVEKPGIVYVARKRTAEELAGALWERGVQGVYYHGGMTKTEREQAQESYMKDEFEVVVATTAFGMGIDKSNVRFVAHYDIPDSIDSLYQEIGRSGRDGEPAEAVLFYRSEDLGIRKFFAAASDSEERTRLEESRLEMMRAYAETRDCRREFLLNYFGEPYEAPCGNCDNCRAGLPSRNEVTQPFPLNARVRHDEWGEGLVVRYEDQKMTVLFDEGGYKTLMTAMVRDRGLLTEA